MKERYKRAPCSSLFLHDHFLIVSSETTRRGKTGDALFVSYGKSSSFSWLDLVRVTFLSKPQFSTFGVKVKRED